MKFSKKYKSYKKNKNRVELKFIKNATQALWQTRRRNIDKSIYRRRLLKGWTV